MNIQFECRSCKRTIEIDNNGNIGGYNVGEMTRKTNWKFISACDVSFWLCTECAEKARFHALEIQKIINHSYIYIAAFMNRDEMINLL